jgi:exodeoxyribonuclease V gamma subunit
MAEEIPLSVVREHWLAQIDQPTLNQPFFAGAVTFATLMPMRAIPFRVVALLGMNDGDYPRSRVPMDFDLMGHDWRPGDRSRREDDRYLFLEALLSARERLHISWVGRSILDQSERPPSVLVAQLRDHLAAGWRLAGDASQTQKETGEHLLHALTVEHRLQPFHPAYFTLGGDPRLLSHAREWRAGLLAQSPVDSQEAAALAPWAFDGPLTLRLLADFLKDPVKSFFRQRLGIHFEAADPVGEDEEPFALDALENWQLQNELIQAQRAALEAGDSREEALATQLARMARRGELPAGHFADLAQERLAEPMEKMFAEYAKALAEWPEALPDAALDHLPEGLAEPLRLSDWLGGLRANAQGERCRLLLDSGSLVKDKRYRLDKLVPFWVAHLAAHLEGGSITSRIVSKAGSVTLDPLDPQQARACWSQLLDAWQQGLDRPLPMALRSALAWLAKGGSAADPAAGAAREAARASYEDSDPPYGKFGECDGNAYLARAYPDFDALWADGEFARWALALLKPMSDAVGRASAKEAA